MSAGIFRMRKRELQRKENAGRSRNKSGLEWSPSVLWRDVRWKVQRIVCLSFLLHLAPRRDTSLSFFLSRVETFPFSFLSFTCAREVWKNFTQLRALRKLGKICFQVYVHPR